MGKKLIKVWNTKLRKAVVASSFEELISKGSKKLNIKDEKFSAFFEDGTEIDDEKEVFQALPAGQIIYLLTDKDKVRFLLICHIYNRKLNNILLENLLYCFFNFVLLKRL